MTGNDQPERELQVYHRAPADAADRFALGSVKLLRLLADWFFGRRYGHRAVILETVAAVPGMVGGALTHLESLRRFEDDRGWIKTLLDEAQNERAHLMTFTQLATPNWFERCLIIAAQGVQFVLLHVPVLAAGRPSLRRLPRGGGNHQLHGVAGRHRRRRDRECAGASIRNRLLDARARCEAARGSGRGAARRSQASRRESWLRRRHRGAQERPSARNPGAGRCAATLGRGQTCRMTMRAHHAEKPRRIRILHFGQAKRTSRG
jgi:hypothetical protein